MYFLSLKPVVTPSFFLPKFPLKEEEKKKKSKASARPEVQVKNHTKWYINQVDL
jgi:hypothetical protein